MNKTITINLANTVFHIDEDAYEILRGYLDSIRHSFEGAEGKEEIIADIEARIAELFGDRLLSERQVITTKEVEEIILIMGQPEDYHVDEDVFTEGGQEGQKYSESSSAESGEERKNRKLYRDMDNNYVGGVCQGLSFYLGIDAVWVRLIFVLLAIFGNGFGLLLYVILWVLVPLARTTAEKLDMRGEPVNISNIEKKVKEGFDQVADSVKNVDYKKMGDSVKGGSQRFFNGLAEVLTVLFRLIAKLVGIVLVIAGGATLIALFFSLFSLGVMDWIDFPGIDLLEVYETSDIPMWALASLSFLAVGIPFYFLMYLGLRLVISTLKSMGWAAKIVLLIVWLMSTGALIAIGLRHSAEYAIREKVYQREALRVATDTVLIRMNPMNPVRWEHSISINGFRLGEDENGASYFYSNNVRLDLKLSPTDSIVVEVEKGARGARRIDARNRAEGIEYGYEWDGQAMNLDGFFTTESENKFRDQSLSLTVHIPGGTVILMDGSTFNRLGYRTEMYPSKTKVLFGAHTWLMDDKGVLNCLDCEEWDEGPEAEELEHWEQDDDPLAGGELGMYDILERHYASLWC